MKKTNLVLFLVFNILLLVPMAHAAQWVKGGGQSCLVACKNERLKPVISGEYSRNTNPYFVCRTNVSGEGDRPGYNLQPNWSNICTVGWGGKEISNQNYDCLCESK